MSFPTKAQIVWLTGHHASGLSDKQLGQALQHLLTQLTIRKGIGRIWLVDCNGNQIEVPGMRK